ncbi:MAG: hypothetical protein II957_04040, partial [Treponema sp.]|nr:hypothetical protein [Treponema sp.]
YDYKMDIAVKQEEAFEDGMEKGLKQGIAQNAVENAKNALALNLPVEQVSQITGLPIEEVLRLQTESHGR